MDEVAVGTGFMESAVTILAKPGEDARVVGRIVGEIEGADSLAGNTDADGAGEGGFVGHGVGIGVEAGVMGTADQHEVGFLLDALGSVFAKELLGGDLGAEGGVGDVAGLQSGRLGKAIFEMAGTGTVALSGLRGPAIVSATTGRPERCGGRSGGRASFAMRS